MLSRFRSFIRRSARKGRSGSAKTPNSLRDLRGLSLLIFDDGLRSRDGHWFEIDKAIAELHRDLDVSVTIVCHRDFHHVHELEAAGARVLPLIERSLWTGWMSRGGLWRELTATWRLASHFRKVLARVLATQPYDCVLHPSAMAADLLAWSFLFPQGRHRVGRVALLARFGLGTCLASGSPVFARKLRYWRWIAGMLRTDLTEDRIRLLTDSSRLAAEYAIVAGISPSLICSPKVMNANVAAPTPAQAVTFGTLGAARIDKGIDLFQSAIAQLIARGRMDGLQFVIQWNRPVPTWDGGVLSRSLATAHNDAVTFIEEPLDSIHYQRRFAAIDCMVLPYRRAIYHSQISGVAVEAACAGIPMIYTADTWLSDFVERFGSGIAVPDGNADALAEAILAIKEDYPRFKCEAMQRSTKARAAYSPERFAEVLWGIERAVSGEKPA